MHQKEKVRVRFAPSPTGGLHLGGVRTVLYNYLYARQNEGTFVLRIEDTDQSRFVQGAEKYIYECLDWCGLTPDESTVNGGAYAPYRQSERKDLYRKYAEQLITSGLAYYAFDTTAELEMMRENLKSSGSSSLQYDHHVRMQMRNSLQLSSEETIQLIDSGNPYVIRLKVPPGETITLHDLIRGEMIFHTDSVDDKVLLKADGMPTYHLAVVVDDLLMHITHAFRGEEWLPSAPAHLLLWKYLFPDAQMPAWAHLPLILKPDGHGKLSKRDGDRLGFPVYATEWKDPVTKDITPGFNESGFLQDAFFNLLAVLGWNDGSEQEIFTLDELIHKFSLEKVHKGGAKFDFEKAKWFNHEWIKKLPVENYAGRVKEIFREKGISISNDEYFIKVLELVKERCILLPDFYEQSLFFFKAPLTWDLGAVMPKWNDDKKSFFRSFIEKSELLPSVSADELEILFKELAAEQKIKPGELLLPLRIMLVGEKFGPAVFDIISLIGIKETSNRIKHFIDSV
ncbi:MAG: glutamate--tRNA ligase [Ferruginibacter sp.]